MLQPRGGARAAGRHATSWSPASAACARRSSPGLERVPAIVRETEEAERLELALIENMAREDLNPIEEARACATLVDDLGVTKEELGRRVGRSRVAISNLIRLLDLPDEALEMLESRRALGEGHGRALLLCQGPRRAPAPGARGARRGWSVRETEARARSDAPAGGRASATAAAASVTIHPDLAELLRVAEEELRPRSDGACASAPRAPAAGSSSSSTIPARRSSWRPTRR